MEGRTGTYYNFLGRASYATDSYLENTLLYDFQLYNVSASEDDVYDLFFDNIEALNDAYAANPDPEFPAELIAQRDVLDLGDVSAITSDITLPELMEDDVLVEWSTSNANVIDVFGTVTRPENIDASVILTAKLTKNGYYVEKEFEVTVLATNGFTSSLVLKYDFTEADTVAGTVTDQAEKHYVGTLENGASIRTIGEAGNQFDVLDFGGNTDSCYFDMGEDVGELIYALSDYTVSLYFFIDSTYTEDELNGAGNFLYTFSNGDSSGVQQNGYMFGRATNIIHVVASEYWGSGNLQTADSGYQPTRGNWHHYVYTQDGGVGTVYFDGDTLSSQEFGNIPSIALVKKKNDRNAI